MATKRTLRITIETEQLLVIRKRAPERAWCERCASVVDTVPLESAAELAQLNRETIQHLLDTEELHLSRPVGPVRVWLKSLLKLVV